MVRKLSHTTTLILSVLVGGLGVDRFMMGQIFWGLCKLFTFGGLGAWWLIDVILIAVKYEFKDVKWV